MLLNNACTGRLGVAAFSGSLRESKLVLLNWCYLVSGEHRDGAQSRPSAIIRVYTFEMRM
jgi:hypothetical protein